MSFNVKISTKARNIALNVIRISVLLLIAKGVFAAEQSAEEIAANLANPNTPMATLTFKTQYRSYAGDLSGASDQNSSTILFQPSLPFTLDSGSMIIFRPAIPFQIGQPSYEGGDSWSAEDGMGDLSFDLAYARTTENGILWAGGVISTLPTATADSLGKDLVTLGPEFLIGKITKKYVIGAFPNHQWDVGGSGDGSVNLTSMQLFYTYLPGGGWNLGSSPTMSYDHETKQATIPLNFTFGKTVIWGKRPWKLSAEMNYYVQKADAFASDWYVGINVAPVVENVFANWFK